MEPPRLLYDVSTVRVAPFRRSSANRECTPWVASVMDATAFSCMELCTRPPGFSAKISTNFGASSEAASTDTPLQLLFFFFFFPSRDERGQPYMAYLSRLTGVFVFLLAQRWQ